MKKFFLPLLGLLIAITSFIPVVELQAKDEYKGKELSLGDVIAYEDGVYDVYLGKDTKGDFKFNRVWGNPVFTPDGKAIEPRWTFDMKKGVWVAGNNFFMAVVDKDKVTLTKDGQTLSWAPSLSIGGKDVKAISTSAYTIGTDPVNSYYYNNILEWDFGVCKRQLRIIEGAIFENWVFNEDPKGEVRIKSDAFKDKNYIWEVTPYGYDAEGSPVPVTLDKKEKIVTAEDMAKAVYPVVIDPSSTFVTSASDGFASYYTGNDSYSNVWNYANGNNNSTNALYTIVGQVANGELGFVIYRSALYFDTSSLGSQANISSAIIKLSMSSSYTDIMTSFSVQVQNGQPTYPRDPLQNGDYNRLLYSGNGGSTSAAAFTADTYVDIELNSTGVSWLNPTGTTKFMLRSTRDISGLAPTKWPGNYIERVGFHTYEMGNGYWPQLVVTYTASEAPTVSTNAATGITISTATLRGYLDNDGGEPADVKFQYGTSTGTYTTDTTTLEGYTTGQNFSQSLSGLNSDVTYYYRAVATNSQGTSYGAELTFTTTSSYSAPTNLNAMPRSPTEITLTWEPGVGSSETLVRYKIGDYPTGTSDGVLVSQTELNTTSLTGLSPGTTYYFKAWGYNGSVYTVTNTTDVATTFASGVVGDDSPISTPGSITGFFSPGDYTGLSNLPFYENFNGIADSLDMPRNTFWMILISVPAVILGASFFLVTRQPLFAVIGVAMGIGYGWVVGVYAGWIFLVFVLVAVALLFTLLGGAQDA